MTIKSSARNSDTTECDLRRICIFRFEPKAFQNKSCTFRILVPINNIHVRRLLHTSSNVSEFDKKQKYLHDTVRDRDH